MNAYIYFISLKIQQLIRKTFLGFFSAEGAPEVSSDPDESISSNQQPKRKLGVYNNLNDKLNMYMHICISTE